MSTFAIKPKDKKFIVDSVASMHMIRKKDLNSAELETVTTSRSPTAAPKSLDPSAVYSLRSVLYATSRVRNQKVHRWELLNRPIIMSEAYAPKFDDWSHEEKR